MPCDSRDTLAKLEDIFGPLKASTPLKLYRVPKDILTSDWLEPYEFSIRSETEEIEGAGGIKEKKFMISDFEIDDIAQNEDLEVLPENEVQNDANSLGIKNEIEQNLFETLDPREQTGKKVEVKKLEEMVEERIENEDGEIASFFPSSDISASLPLACYDLQVTRTTIPQTLFIDSELELSDVPLSNILVSSSESRKRRRSSEKETSKPTQENPNSKQPKPGTSKTKSASPKLDRQGVAALYKKIASGLRSWSRSLGYSQSQGHYLVHIVCCPA